MNGTALLYRIGSTWQLEVGTYNSHHVLRRWEFAKAEHARKFAKRISVRVKRAKNCDSDT
jgi:hypothetical protein